MRAEHDQLACQLDALRTENASLRAKLEEARRAGKRQAAPFSRERRTPQVERPPSSPAFGRQDSGP